MGSWCGRVPSPERRPFLQTACVCCASQRAFLVPLESASSINVSIFIPGRSWAMMSPIRPVFRQGQTGDGNQQNCNRLHARPTWGRLAAGSHHEQVMFKRGVGDAVGETVSDVSSRHTSLRPPPSKGGRRCGVTWLRDGAVPRPNDHWYDLRQFRLPQGAMRRTRLLLHAGAFDEIIAAPAENAMPTTSGQLRKAGSGA